MEILPKPTSNKLCGSDLIHLQEEKAQRHGQTFNWQTATYEKVKYSKDEDDCFTNFKTKFPAIVFDDILTSDTVLSCESTVSPLNKNKIDFRISFDESNDEDYMVIFDENSFSYKIFYVDDLKMDSKKDNDKIDMPSFPEPMISHSDDLDFFKDFENEFPTITYNDDLTSKLTEPSVSFQHIEEFNLNDETSLSKYDEEEQNVLYFNDAFPINIVFPNNLKSDKDIDDDEIDVTQSSRSNAINIDTKGSNKLLKTSYDMVPLPPRDQIHPWLRYQVERYTKDIVHNYEQRLETIWGRSVNRVHILDFAGLTEGIRQTLADRLRMVYTEEEVHELQRSIVGLRGDVDRSITDQGRFTTWMVSCMTQLMDASDHTYQAFDNTLVGNSQLPYQRRTRQVMEFESAHSNTTAKLPILKLVTKMSVPVTAEENTNKKNDVKARSLLLMDLPNEHQLTFSQYNDAKIMFATIKTQFGVWMNKAEIETMSIDDLYNNFKIVKQSVKKYVGASSGAQNLAFMTAPSTTCTNDVNTANPAYEVSTVSPNVNTPSQQVSTASFSDNVVYAFMVENPNGSNLLQQDLEKIHEDDLEAMDLKWQLSLLSMRENRYFQRTGKKIFINANDTVGYDKSKVEYFNCHNMGHFARECRAPRNKEGQFRKHRNNEDTSSKALLAIDGVGFYWSDMAEEQVQTNMALIAFSDSEVYNDKTCSKTCLKNYETLKKQCDDLNLSLIKLNFQQLLIKRFNNYKEQTCHNATERMSSFFSERLHVLKREVACKDYEINVLKSFDNASKSLNKLLESQITDKSKKGLGYNAVPPPHPLIYNRPKQLDLSYSGLDEFKDPEFKSYGSKDSKLESNIVCDTKSDDSKENSDDSLIRSYNTKLNAVKAKRVNVVKNSACWVWRPTRPNGASLVFKRHNNIDARGRSNHKDDTDLLTWIPQFKSHNWEHSINSQFQGFDDVTFWGGAHGVGISVSHRCADKKNYVLFTDTKCLVLSPNFKLPDESQILLKIPRKDNMYSFDMKNIVPKESLTLCLFAKIH
ncbi:putative ribonuclease H-like domain-containing protein [Tanacetum coccineum]